MEKSVENISSAPRDRQTPDNPVRLRTNALPLLDELPAEQRLLQAAGTSNHFDQLPFQFCPCVVS